MGTMKELITKLNPSASISEKEELAAIVSSAPNFDLDGDGNINMREMITKLNGSTVISLSSGQEKKLFEKKEGPFDYVEMEKMYQKQFNTRERADFLKEFNLDGDGNIAIKEMIATLNPPILEKKITEKNGPARRRHYGYLDPTLASKAKERNFSGVDLDVARAESK